MNAQQTAAALTSTAIAYLAQGKGGQLASNFAAYINARPGVGDGVKAKVVRALLIADLRERGVIQVQQVRVGANLVDFYRLAAA